MTTTTIAVVDYGRGNLFSIARALETVGANAVISEEARVLRAADALVLPGVGAFRDAMAGLRSRGLNETICGLAGEGVPLLGICLGMQVLFSRSEEFGHCDGLDLIPGSVRRLPAFRPGPDGVRIPNVGWRRLAARGRCPLLEPVSAGAMFYFVHSFVPEPENQEDVVGTIQVNGTQAAVLVRQGSVFGCQFHPEKSGPEGLALLRGFLNYAEIRVEGRRVA